MQIYKKTETLSRLLFDFTEEYVQSISNIDKILEFNREYVANKGYEKHITDKFPDKKLAVLSCMDTRLSVLLQEALGLQNGDAKIIKNAGALNEML